VDQYFDEDPRKPLEPKLKTKEVGTDKDITIDNEHYRPGHSRDTLFKELPTEALKGMSKERMLGLAQKRIALFLETWFKKLPSDTAFPSPAASPAFELFP
jgi:hypothetical protein